MKVSKKSESEEKKNTVIWGLIDVFKPYTALSLLLALSKMSGDCCWWNFWVNVNTCEFWEYWSIFYDERSFGKSRKCCWCRIWLYCILYMEVVLLMKILKFLNLKWINFWPYLPHPLPLPILASCEDIGG